MHRHPKILVFYINRSIVQQQRSLRHLRTKPSRRRYPRNHHDDSEKMETTKEHKQENIYFYKSKGQHILTNERILNSIVQKSDIKSSDTILEIGPGTGNLTLKLLEVAKKVVAIEIDKRMVEILNRRVDENGLQDRLTVICKDALKTEFPQFDLAVANIPYGISSPLVARLVYGLNPFRSATLLLQKEFARRLLANPGESEFNRLAVNVKLMADVEFVMDVSKRDFLPSPKVDSSVVIIRPKAEIPDINLDEWLAFTRTCFSKKNKTFGATFRQKKKVMELWRLSEMAGSCETTLNGCNFNCSSDDEDEEHGKENDEGDSNIAPCSEMGLSFFRETIIRVLKSCGFEEKRPSKLSNEELLHLLSLFNQAGIYFHDQAKPRNEGDSAYAASDSS